MISLGVVVAGYICARCRLCILLASTNLLATLVCPLYAYYVVVLCKIIFIYIMHTLLSTTSRVLFSSIMHTLVLLEYA